MMRSWMPLLLIMGQVVPVLAQQNPPAKPDAPPTAKDERSKPSTIDLDLAKKYFGEAKRLAESDGGKLWGKSLAGPMLFVDPRSRFVVANQADEEKKLKLDGGVFVGTLPSNVPVANTACRWVGTHWSMVLWPLPNDKADRSILLMHESWHRIQTELGLPSIDPANAHLDTLEGRYWLQLEWRALARALSSSEDDRRKAIEDALRFRQHRRGLFKEAASEENALELHEGLAEYTGIKLSALSEAEQQRLLVKRFETMPAEIRTFVRTFTFLSGPAYGLLLDHHAAGWLRKLKPGDDMGQMLATALDLKLAKEAEASTKERAGRYDGEKLLTAEAAREESRLKKVAAFRRLLIDGPVLMLPLSKQQMSFNPSELVPIKGVGTVYPTLTLIGPWGKLEVRNASLITSDFKKAFVTAPVKSEERVLTGEGWELRLEAGWKAVKGERKGDWKLVNEN
jgi:hypothetical protein